MRTTRVKMALPILLAAAVLAPSFAPRASAGAAGADARTDQARSDARAATDRALAYLKARQQADGSWQRNPREPLAVTALVLRAFALDEKTGPNAEFVKRGYAWLLAQQQGDGGIYKDGLANYTTAIAV